MTHSHAMTSHRVCACGAHVTQGDHVSLGVSHKECVKHDSWPMTHVSETWVMSHRDILCETWDPVRHDIHTCDMTRSCMWHASFVCVTWLVHVCDMTHVLVWHDSVNMWHCSSSDLVRHCPACARPVWHDSFTCESCHTYKWVMSHI